MCNKCGKEKPGKVHLVSLPKSLIEFAKERSFEEIVKYNGCMVVATTNSDYDKKGNFIGDYSKDHKRAEKYVQKYNPDGLSYGNYRKEHSNGKLPWQNQ